MIQVGIMVVSCCDMFPQRSRSILGKHFAHISIDGDGPIVFFYLNIGEIRFIGKYPDCRKSVLRQVPNHVFHAFKMTLLRCCPEGRHETKLNCYRCSIIHLLATMTTQAIVQGYWDSSRVEVLFLVYLSRS
jgi:hypothetical protein